MSSLQRWLRANPLLYVLTVLVIFSGAGRAATFVVDSNADTNLNACTVAAGDCTLRGAITAANNAVGADTITFDPSVAPTITLVSFLPTITENVTITGLGANVLTIQGFTPATNPDSIAGNFSVDSGISADFSGLTLSCSGGYSLKNNGGTVSVTNCVFFGTGLGIYIADGIRNSGTLTVTNCTLRNHSNAGIYSGSGTLTLSNSTVNDNSEGVAAYGGPGGSTITNCTFTGNGHAAMSFLDSMLTVTNCTVQGNASGLSGVSSSSVTLIDTICVDGNLGNPTITQQGNNILSGNPLLGALANNGGPTLTMMPQTGSPAIDGALTSTLTSDQRGFLRPTDGDGDSSPVVDIGAVEVGAVVLPCLTINNVSVTEGNAGTTNAVFTVTLSAASTQAVTMSYAVTNGTATSGSDYGTASDSDGGTPGILTIPAGQTTGTITVPVFGDTMVESTENFFVDLSASAGTPVHATFCDEHCIGTIKNDDVLPCLTINDVSVTEGNAGTTNAVFTVTLSTVSSAAVTVNYAIANGTATSGSDYGIAFDSDGGTPGMLTIPAGQTTGTITVPVLGDIVQENNETFFVNLSSATNATICDKQGVGSIKNDDRTNIFVSDVQMMEGNVGNRAMYFTIALSGPLPTALTVNYVTGAGTNNSATAGSDYVSVTAGSVTFPIGTVSMAVPVDIVGDVTPEADETFVLKLTSAPGAIITKAIGVGTIVNDDGPGALWIANQCLTPGSASSIAGVEQQFVASYFLSSGNTGFTDCRFLVGAFGNPVTTTTGQNALYGKYDAATNKLYLMNNANSQWLPVGGITPGTSVSISNSQGTLSGLHSSVIRSGTNLIVVWAFTPVTGFAGAKDLRMWCRANSLTANWEEKGTWTIAP